MPVRGPHFLREVANSWGLTPVVPEISSATAPYAGGGGPPSPQTPAPHPTFTLHSSSSPGGPLHTHTLLGFFSPGPSWGLPSVKPLVLAHLGGADGGAPPPAVLPDCQSEGVKSLPPAGATPLCKSPLGSTAGDGVLRVTEARIGHPSGTRLPCPSAAPPQFSAA